MTHFFSTVSHLLRGRIPAQLVIQMTSRCNARCPQCGMRITNPFPRSTLDLDTLRKIIDAAARKKVQAVSFTGGEPLLYPDLLIPAINHAGKAGIPFIRTGTNGFLFRDSTSPDFTDRMKRLADTLSATPLRNFWISMDSSVPSVHEQMRGLAGVVKGIETALPIFHSAGLYPSVNLGINRRVSPATAGLTGTRRFSGTRAYLEAFFHSFTQAFDDFYRMAANLGFTIVNTCYPMSVDNSDSPDSLKAVYAATARDSIVRFTSKEKALLYRALMAVIPRHRSHLRIFTPVSSLSMLAAGQEASAGHATREDMGCRGGIDFFFINAEDGQTYPCGYRGNENLGPFPGLDIRNRSTGTVCRQCDWECFRDPSEMFAPFLDGLNRPVKLIKRLLHDREYFSLWKTDLQYYSACDLFNGRTPPDWKKLRQFGIKPACTAEQPSFSCKPASLSSRSF